MYSGGVVGYELNLRLWSIKSLLSVFVVNSLKTKVLKSYSGISLRLFSMSKILTRFFFVLEVPVAESLDMSAGLGVSTSYRSSVSGMTLLLSLLMF